MKNAFDYSGPSEIGKKLQKQAHHQKRMSQWVNDQRKEGKDACMLALNPNAAPLKKFTMDKL